MKITNTQSGPRGINAVSGPALIEPKQTWEGEVYARERQHIEASGWFEVEGEYTANPDAKPGTAAAPSGDDALKARIADLEGQIAAKDAEIVKLKAGNGGQDASGTASTYTVKEQSPGWHAIVDGDGKVLTKNFRADDLKDFAGLDADKQAAFVEANKAD